MGQSFLKCKQALSGIKLKLKQRYDYSFNPFNVINIPYTGHA